ncbi:MAG: hypothetical protein LH606_13790 [Cytophagaceae bacterium]|nr:hypothetical protein [Cytophagaceae bacterium]
MKTLRKVKSKRQSPEFWNEHRLKVAIEEVDRSAMSAEKRLAYEMLIAQNAVAVYGEKKKIEDARQEENLAVKMDVVKKALLRGKLSIEEIAEDNAVSTDFVLDVQKQLREK